MKMSFVLLAVLVAALSCRQGNAPEPAPNEPSAPASTERAAWEAEVERLTGLVAVGMTKEQVVQTLGEPKEARGLYGARSHGYWLYRLTSNLWFRVDFDERDRVENRRAWSGVPGPQ